MVSIVLSTRNTNKLDKINNTLKEHDLIKISDFTSEEPEENGLTYETNSYIKAKFARKVLSNTKYYVLADDSGMEVDILGGLPGVFTANWVTYNGKRDWKKFIETLYSSYFKDATLSRKIQFICILCLIEPSNKLSYFKGRLSGTFTYPPRGEIKNNPDSIFIPDGYTKTLGELSTEERNDFVDHRGIALLELKKYLETI